MRNRVRVTVGPESGQFVGVTHRAIQAAVDYVARLGGGTVELLAGVFQLGNAVHLRSGVRLVGQGERTRLIKNASVTTALTDDTDWYERRITVADPRGFELGGGLLLKGRRVHEHEGWAYMKHTVVGIDDGTITVVPQPADQPRHNFWITHDAIASTLFPLVTANGEEEIAIEHLTLDGNRDENDFLDGNYGGCIFLQDCRNVRVVGVRAENNNGDGISWQVCDDVRVEECVSVHHAGLGLHPGSGSQRPIIRRNTIRDCRIGLFWCWGVRYGVAEENEIEDISAAGISIGHRDTDNVIRRNTIASCGRVGLHFRPEEPAIRAAHRNVVEENTFRDTGMNAEAGVGIHVDAAVEGVVLRRNRIESARGTIAYGIRIGPTVGNIVCEGNSFDGVLTPVYDERLAKREAGA